MHHRQISVTSILFCYFFNSAYTINKDWQLIKNIFYIYSILLQVVPREFVCSHVLVALRRRHNQINLIQWHSAGLWSAEPDWDMSK